MMLPLNDDYDQLIYAENATQDMTVNKGTGWGNAEYDLVVPWEQRITDNIFEQINGMV